MIFRGDNISRGPHFAMAIFCSGANGSSQLPCGYGGGGRTTYLPTAYLLTYLPTYLHVCLPAYMPTCLATYLATCLPTYLPTAYLRSCLPASCLPAAIAIFHDGDIPRFSRDGNIARWRYRRDCTDCAHSTMAIFRQGDMEAIFYDGDPNDYCATAIFCMPDVLKI